MEKSVEKVNTNNNNESESELELLQLSKKFFKMCGIVFSGYLFGWTGMSIAWPLIGVFVYTIRYKYHRKQTEKVKLQRNIALNEKLAITCAVKDLPSWVYFPDTERAEWVNKVLKQMWPFIDEYTKTLIKQSIEPNIASSLPDFLKSFRFEKVDLGTVPCRIGSVKCYDENTSRNEIILDIELIYAGNCDIQMRVKGMKFGIKDFQLYGIARVELRPLLKDMPLIGCVSFYFLNSPAIEFNLTNLADILDMPGLSDYLRRAIKEQLAAFMVLPNKYVFPLVNDLSMQTIKFLQPVGAVRIEVIEARNLKKSDVGVLGLGKSDPYVRILVGSQEFKSPVIYNTVNPKWNFVCEVVVHYLHGQNIELEVMDEDQGSADDFLGRTSLPLNTISSDGLTEAWLTLKDTKTGALHVRTTWFSFSDCIQDLDISAKESKEIKKKYQSIVGRDECDSTLFGSVAAVLVYLDCARNLPIISKTAGEPDPYCILSIGREKRHSIVKNGTKNPIWEETFNFLVDDLNKNIELHSEIIDSKTNKQLGTTKLKLEKVISCEELKFNQPLPIKGRGEDCELNITVIIKILKMQTIKKSAKLVVEEPNSETEETNIPTLEDIIKGTVQPIIDTSGLNTDVIERSQNDRRHSVSKTNGSKPIENNSEEEIESNASSDFPRVQLSVKKLDSIENKLIVILHRAENLPRINDKDPDPYIKIFKIPDKTSRTLRETRMKSDTKRNTCNPIFDENFEMDSDWETFNGIEIVVYSRHSSSNIFKKKSKTIIGLTSVELNALKESGIIEEWFDLEQITD